MRKHKFKLILIAILIIPIIVNSILGYSAPFCIKVFGSTDAWLAFYGAYFGGIITAAIGFVTIHRQEKLNNKKILISHQETLIRDLENRLSNCISLFDYSRVGIIALYFDDKSKYDDVLKEMDVYHHKLVIASNTWNTIYGSDTNNINTKAFQEKYNKCINKMTEALNKVTVCINIIKETNDVEVIKRCKSEIKKIIILSYDYQEQYIKPLQNKAQEWLKSERCKLQEMQSS